MIYCLHEQRRDVGEKSINPNKIRVSYLHRTATTAYPCYLPVLGEFSGSWSYKTYPRRQKYKYSFHICNIIFFIFANKLSAFDFANFLELKYK